MASIEGFKRAIAKWRRRMQIRPAGSSHELEPDAPAGYGDKGVTVGLRFSRRRPSAIRSARDAAPATLAARLSGLRQGLSAPPELDDPSADHPADRDRFGAG